VTRYATIGTLPKPYPPSVLNAQGAALGR
jgi:hypothetical protein